VFDTKAPRTGPGIELLKEWPLGTRVYIETTEIDGDPATSYFKRIKGIGTVKHIAEEMGDDGTGETGPRVWMYIALVVQLDERPDDPVYIHPDEQDDIIDRVCVDCHVRQSFGKDGTTAVDLWYDYRCNDCHQRFLNRLV
jgi:hypothetical protein